MIRAAFVAAAMAATLSASAAGQPRHAPHYLEVVTASGARERLSVDRQELSLLAAELATRDFRARRGEVRMLCASRCPETAAGSRPRQDVIVWGDGRRTAGPVFIYREAVEQGGRRAGRLEEVRSIELGTAPLPAGLVRELRPRAIEAFWDDPWGGGEFVVFRFPWITLSPAAVTFHGRDPIQRGGNLRSIRLSDNYPERQTAWPEEDVVTWQDGSRTSGQVTVSGGSVRQPGRPPQSLRDVAYIDFRRR